MDKKYSITAAVLAAIIGAMAVFAGGRVLLGAIPDYYVIDWLPIYNFSLGVISLFFTSAVIWRQSRHAIAISMATLGAHGVVMLILLIAYRPVVAVDSLVAMTIRIVAWVVITALVFAGKKKTAS